MKWIVGWTAVIVVVGMSAFCSGTAGMSIFAYLLYVGSFFAIFSFMLLWFDLQYDMTTIL